MASKKNFGFFTGSAGKAIKDGTRIICRVGSDGRIYITNGFIMLRMLPEEYAETVQAVTCCDAGAWIIENGKRRELLPDEMDLEKLFNNHAAPTNTSKGPTLCERCPMQITVAGNKFAAYYNPDAGTVCLYNPLYISAFDPTCELHAVSPTSAAQIVAGQEAVGIVLPIRPDAAIVRAVKAYYTDADAEQAAQAAPDAAELEALRAELTAATEYGDAKRAEVEELYTRNAAQAAELEALRAELDQAKQAAPAPAAEAVPAEDPAPDMRSAAEIIAARFTALAGVKATIKGAQTAAPVVWLDGETKKHADAIREAGAKWSAKKRAFYVRVA